MIFSGPNPVQTYHDSYMRKRNTSRSLADPPTLLTDRGAYLNYLESQLERVTAALITTNAYEQRLTDLQTLTSTLEQRVTSNTSLVALSSQLIDELKKDNNDRMDAFTTNIINENKAIKLNQEFIMEKMTILENTMLSVVDSLEPLKERLFNVEKNISNCQHIQNEHYNEINDKIATIDTNIHTKIDSINNTTNLKISNNYNDLLSKIDGNYTNTNRKIDENISTINNKIDNNFKDTNDKHEQFTITTNSINDTISVLKTLIQRNDEAIESNNNKITNFNGIISSRFQELANNIEVHLMDEVNKLTRTTGQQIEEKFITETESLQRSNSQRFDQEKADITRLFEQMESNTKRIVTLTCDDLIGEVFVNKENLNLLRLEVNANTNTNNELRTIIQQAIDTNTSNHGNNSTKINEIFKALDIINNIIDTNNNNSQNTVSTLKDEMLTQFQNINTTFSSFDQIQEKIVLNIANLNNDISSININMGKNFESVSKDIQETLAIIEENKANSDEKILACEKSTISSQDFKRFERKMEESISRFLANTAVNVDYAKNSGGSISSSVKKVNDSIINENTDTQSNTYRRVTDSNNNNNNSDDNDDNSSSGTTFSQINAKHNALSMFLSQYKNDQGEMVAKLEEIAAAKYDKKEKDRRDGRSRSTSTSLSPKRSSSTRRSSSPRRSTSPHHKKEYYDSPQRRVSYHDVAPRYLDPNPRFSKNNNSSNTRMLSPFFSRLSYSKNPNPWVPNKNLSYVGSGDKGSSPESNNDTNTHTSTTTTTSTALRHYYHTLPKHKTRDHLKGSRLK